MSFKKTKRKGFNFFRSYYDVYNELEKDSEKLAFIEALLDRQFLGVQPNNLTGMARFAWISQVNSIDSQVKGYEDKTGLKLTPCQPPTQGGGETPNEQVEVKVKEQEEQEKPKRFPFKKSLCDLGVQKEVAEQWMQVRSKKKAVNSEIAFNSIKNQIEKSKLNANDVIIKCVEKSWSGFESEWIKDEIKPQIKRSIPNYGL